MTYDIERGRQDLFDFDSAQPENYWATDPHLQQVIKRWAGESTFDEWAPGFEAFGADCAGIINTAIEQNNHRENLPILDRYSTMGERVEEVAHHPSFHLAGRAIYGSGVMPALLERNGNLRALTLFYLSAQNGEGGHNCPLACTGGLIKALTAVGAPELKEQYLPRLLATDYAILAHGAQFLTEVQGGSDVGANSVRALQQEDGSWQLFGEKWFCSNVTADVILLTARPDGAPEGTKGLALFLMPRRLPDGSLNEFSIRRLKEKIGTRTLPTAEVDLNGARVWSVGSVQDGFRNMMTYVINTSRTFNAVACTGAARRALVVAQSFARFREAFGSPIRTYPMTQETLADMLAETTAMVSGTLHVAHIVDRVEGGDASEHETDFLRVALNLNKVRTALSAHEVITSGIEVLAGNGTIETFSVLPRLLRDNIVYENWEGSHNVLLLQVLRDCQRKKLHRGFFAHLQTMSSDQRIGKAIEQTEQRFEELIEGDPAVAAIGLREIGSRMAFLHWACAMLCDGTANELREHFIDRRIGPSAPRDASYLERIASLAQQ